MNDQAISYEVTVKRTFELKLSKPSESSELLKTIIAVYDDGEAREGTIYQLKADHETWSLWHDDDLDVVLDQIDFEIRETEYELN
jgi:hypothetical protein